MQSQVLRAGAGEASKSAARVVRRGRVGGAAARGHLDANKCQQAAGAEEAKGGSILVGEVAVQDGGADDGGVTRQEGCVRGECAQARGDPKEELRDRRKPDVRGAELVGVGREEGGDAVGRALESQPPRVSPRMRKTNSTTKGTGMTSLFSSSMEALLLAAPAATSA